MNQGKILEVVGARVDIDFSVKRIAGYPQRC